MSATPYYAIWLLLIYAWVANYLIRMALGALLAPIMSELALSYTQAGFLSTAFFYAYMAMQFPAGAFGDRFGRRRSLITGVLLGAVAAVATGLAGSFGGLFAARLLTGISQGFLFSNDRVIIAATTPKDRIALGQGISFSGPGLGTTLGLLLAGALGGLMAWRSVFMVFALPPLVAALLIWRLIPEPPRHAAVADPGWPFRRVLRARDFWLLGLTGIMPVYVQFVLATWAPLFFVEIGVTDLPRSASLASLQGLPAPFALLLSGLLADRFHRRGTPRKLIIAATLLLTALSVTAMGLTVHLRGPAWLLIVSMLATSFFFWCAWSPAYAIFGELFPASVLGRAFGLYNTTCFLGAIVGPLVTGWIRDVTGSFAVALWVSGVLCLSSVVLVMALRPSRRPSPAGSGSISLGAGSSCEPE
ncbi:MAG TPA: MFS transporter [Methylomirabilota bacterium]|jgi:MFS family permease|nr:MFS transporter [Methylomirabilota bacterium]